MEKIESHKCFGGVLSVYEHESDCLKSTMKFSVFLPENAERQNVPFITFLSGLTCTHENFTHKAGAYQKAAEMSLAIIAPDTSPRGEDVPDEPNSYDFGKGASFYINATENPWAEHYQMETYITEELQSLVCNQLPLNKESQGICGHSMGGHGALTLFLKHSKLYKSVSAFSPIVAPAQVPWGRKAFARYLGQNEEAWKKHDATELVSQVQDASNQPEILIDQGLSDQFLLEQLRPEIFKEACHRVGQKLNLRLHEGYDHSYYFIQSFIDDHITHHAKILNRISDN